MPNQPPSRTERKTAAIALAILALIELTLVILYNLGIIESGISVLIVAGGGIVAIAIAVRAYVLRKR